MFDQPSQPDDDFDPPAPCCAICAYELHGTDYSRLACRECQDRLYKQLVEVEKFWAKLPSAAHRPVGDRQEGRRMSVYPGIPGNGNVINLTGPGAKTPLGQLRAVEDDWRGARGFNVQTFRGSTSQTMPLVLKFLRDHLPWACGPHLNPPLLQDGSPLLPDVHALSEALGPIVGQLKQAVNEEAPRRLVQSRCLAPYVAGFDCPGRVWVGVDIEPKWCLLCGTSWDRETWMRWAREGSQFGAAA